MPARNLVRINLENSYHHIYNRGVEKRIIFNDEQDYKVFLKYLKEYLSPPPDPKEKLKSFTLKGLSFKGMPRQPKNYHGKIELVAYCLMPNHFHFLIHQVNTDQLEMFMRSLCTRYSMYFNKKYSRVGSLFQGPYKSVLVNEEPYLLHLSRYIHLNPKEIISDIENAFSSYAEYLGIRKTLWIKSDIVISFFDKAKNDFLKGTNTYKKFIEAGTDNSESFLGNITLENTP